MKKEETPKKSPEEEEDYSFLQETIKDEKRAPKKVFAKIGKMAGYGFVFGLMACLGFGVLKPYVEAHFRTNQQKVTFPQDEVDEDADAQTPEDTQTQEPVTMDDYREMNNTLYEVASQAEKSMVIITGTKTVTEPATDTEAEKQTTETINREGVLIADNGQELLVLLQAPDLGEVSDMSVTLTDGSTHAATIKQCDTNLGIEILSVTRSSVSGKSLGEIQIASLGNSYLLKQGDTMIALGDMFGYQGGIGYGVVSSTDQNKAFADGDYGLLATDIPGKKEGSGVLFNIDGEVVGVLDQDAFDGEEITTSVGIGISDLKAVIENLSNGETFPYLGIRATVVTAEMQEKGMPEGLYVRGTDVDSPAMTSGIQNGDIIVKIGKKKVSSMNALKNDISGLKTGEQVSISVKRLNGAKYADLNFDVTVGSKNK